MTHRYRLVRPKPRKSSAIKDLWIALGFAAGCYALALILYILAG